MLNPLIIVTGTNIVPLVAPCPVLDKAAPPNLVSTARKRSEQQFSTKDFPRPFPHLQTTSIPSTPVIRYNRDLKGVTGVVTQPEMESQGFPPTGLGDGVDRYLDAHGYDAGSRLHIMHAWREHPGKREFVIYACARGMAMAEAKWLWQLLLDDCY
jgi:hypothetical protein